MSSEWNTSAVYASNFKAARSGATYDARGFGYRAVVALGKLFRSLKGERVYVITAL